jgi:hypothetical protein
MVIAPGTLFDEGRRYRSTCREIEIRGRRDPASILIFDVVEQTAMGHSELTNSRGLSDDPASKR